jgi:serine/threonine-protein kinase
VPLLGAQPRHWIRAARDVALALVYIHERGKVHRDVKARNVLFSDTGEVRLVDFALAAVVGGKVPRGGGTLAYERLAQRHGAPPEVADDVHAFAVLLYELLAGRLPFGVNPPLDALQAEPSPRLATPDGAGPGARALAELIQETLSPGQKSAPGGVHPFLDVLESMLLEYH